MTTPEDVERLKSQEELDKLKEDFENKKRVSEAAREGFYGKPVCCEHCSGNHHGDTCPHHGWAKVEPKKDSQ